MEKETRNVFSGPRLGYTYPPMIGPTNPAEVANPEYTPSQVVRLDLGTTLVTSEETAGLVSAFPAPAIAPMSKTSKSSWAMIRYR